MVETSKQVRVDNWGVYFLQRLQLFFSKTDYCDLTLQFDGNVQLKVHRLVMNACTEYFTFLEQTCPAVEENTILMPPDLQADVIVPIVNFMYTGMLEFHPSIYDKLYRAAETMNIAVLPSLLEAQLPPYNKAVKRDKNIISRKEVPVRKPFQKAPPPITTESPVTTLSAKKKPLWNKRNSTGPTLQSHPVSATFTTTKWNSDPIEKDSSLFTDNTPKPTRFEWPEDDLSISSMYSSFDEVSLTSKPLWTKDDAQKAAPAQESTAQFSPRRKSTSTSQDYDDEFIEKDDKANASHSEESAESSLKRKAEEKDTSSPKRVKITTSDEETVISIVMNNPNEVDHTKIVSEILKKFPDLVKKKRNIKLKIHHSKTTEQPQIKVQTVKEKVKSPQLPSPVEKAVPPTTAPKEKRENVNPKDSQPSKVDTPSRMRQKKVNFKAASEEGPWTCMDCFGEEREGAEFVLYYLFRKHMADQHQMEFDASLCKYCGKKCPKKNYMDYHLYTKHGLKPPRDVVFPKCNRCPFIALTTDRLAEHIKTHGPDEVQCMSCHLGFLTSKDLQAHQQISGHSNKSSSILDCAYCLKKLQSPVTLFTHVRSQHMKEARKHGISSLDEFMDILNEDVKGNSEEVEEEPELPKEEAPARVENNKAAERQLLKDRVKILSNVKVENLPETAANKADATPPQPVAISTTTAALTNIGGSLATNLGLVDIVVLDDNQQYILQQPQGQPSNAEFILPHDLTGGEGILQAAAATGEINSTDELVMVLTDHDYQDEQTQRESDNSNIVVLYSHPVEGQQGQFITSQGNLLVNSDGVLEIRNGASITTTAGQLLVNDSTITTQATESPIESIDLIRKEIEATEENGRERDIKTALSKDVLEKVVKESSVPPLENQAEQNKNSLDTPDSSFPEEPMEVDPIGLPDREEPKEIGSQEVHHSVESESQEIPDILEPVQTDRLGSEDPGHDVPPDITSIPQNVPIAPELPDSQLLLNDAADFELPSESLQEQQQMEVDGVPSEQNMPGLDEVDQHIPQAPEIPPDTESFACFPEATQEPEKLNMQDEHEEEEKSVEQTCSIAESQENSTKENCAEDNSQEDSDIKKDPSDSNENVQPNYDDLTDESQHSSGQKAPKDLNKEILDDWDDTDSQQSQSQGQESQESEPQPAALNAAENVTKLMDDWDDEDEDQTKE